jgi:peroxiredoxin (alkyl hydroperoxide reductase subunit C)
MENRILGIGNKLPEFNKKAVVSLEAGKEFGDISLKMW